MSDHHFGDQRDDQPGDRPVDAIGARTGTRARGLINDGDPRVAAVERQLGPELVEPLPPERLRYLAALAVAVCDEHADRGDRGADDRPARREERGGRGERTRSAHAERSRATRALAGVLAGVFLLLLLVLAASVVAAVAAAVIALWRAVL
ncbi:hypothetical protein L7D48_04815 [Streptomyces sp. S1A]|uniref:DUF3040 domain-containing protein n=1 Tax=Streptomyces chitinivorans TaxID=1257027 RepID=A0ABW7HVP4_9ACTN|nr:MULTISPECIES: hypothetical protein [Streptomyces]MCG3039894.1 hypothetical protein [Streptomyces sp. ICN903]MDH2410029.1 hypothetical protein [Streptomyces chitinivorans]